MKTVRYHAHTHIQTKFVPWRDIGKQESDKHRKEQEYGYANNMKLLRITGLLDFFHRSVF
jgi:hypothetical protein